MNNSSYTDYLPPVLWTDETDPTRFLGRSLRIFERVLTGLQIRAEVVRAEGAMASAAGNQIIMASGPDAQRFRVGDRVEIVGAGLTRTVVTLDPAALILDTPVPALGAGTVRIADHQAGDTRLRLDAVSPIGPGSLIRLSQGPLSEVVRVAANDHETVTLAAGLTHGYAMTATAMPVAVSDGTVLTSGGTEYPDFESRIDRLADVFSPWRTSPEYLPYLASWMALTLRQEWTDYEKRWLIANIHRIYRERGLKHGLFTYLGIYAPSAARPRIAVDDGDAILRLARQDDGTFAFREVAHANTLSHTGGTRTVLLHPSGIAHDAANDYFVADHGDIGLGVPRPAALWRVSQNGEVPYAAGPPAPLPAPIHSGAPLALPMAVTVDNAGAAAVVDIGSAAFVLATDLFSRIVRFAPPGYAASVVIDQASVPNLPAVHPVDMILDGAGAFVVLDRGLHAFGNPPQGPTSSQLVIVTEGPLAVATHALASVTEPTAIVMDAAGRFIVADARDQTTSLPVELVRVDPAAGFAETPLLAAVAAGDNPLVFPTGLAFEDDTTLLVLDQGARMGFVGDTKNRRMAEDAALYRVDLAQVPPTITRVTEERALVMPTKLKIDRNGDPVLVDRGEAMAARSWRASANEFGVSLLFSNQRPTTFDERNLVRRGIHDVIDEQKPSHTVWWMDF